MPLYSKAYVPGVGPSHRLLTYSRLPPVWTLRTYVLALAVVVVVRWTKSRSTGPLSLLPCREYFPVKVWEVVPPFGNIAIVLAFLSSHRKSLLLDRQGAFVFQVLRYPGPCVT